MKIIFYTCIIMCLMLMACAENNPKMETTEPIHLAVVGQTLIKIDPRTHMDEPLASIRPILASADIGFTNFEMAVDPSQSGQDNDCNMPDDYVTILGENKIPRNKRPGNVSNPHAVSADIMNFLAGMNFNLMSLANNHSWDLGTCGVMATIAAAKKNGVAHAGAGATAQDALAPAIITVKGKRIALIATTTSLDERALLLGNINGVWTGNADDRRQNLKAIADARKIADFVIYYQHFQLANRDFRKVSKGKKTKHGHLYIPSVDDWQTEFAKDVIDAGAGLYIGHGHRGYDGIEIYKGRPIIRQFGGFAYQGLQNPGSYDGDYAFWGLIGDLTIQDDTITHMEFVPLSLNEGQDLFEKHGRKGFLTRRGYPELANGALATEILERLQNLSTHYGTEITIKGERAFLEVNTQEKP